MKTMVNQKAREHSWWALLSLLMLTLLACKPESRGFVLPEGDIATGKQLFVSLNCTDCHSIGVLARNPSTTQDYPDVHLGGEVTALKTYGELVTSVINPTHKLSQKWQAQDNWVAADGTSRMGTRAYNEILTVQQLIDLVAFLQSEYRLIMPENPYPYN